MDLGQFSSYDISYFESRQQIFIVSPLCEKGDAMLSLAEVLNVEGDGGSGMERGLRFCKKETTLGFGSLRL